MQITPVQKILFRVEQDHAPADLFGGFSGFVGFACGIAERFVGSEQTSGEIPTG
jgi:hypothetical protein